MSTSKVIEKKLRGGLIQPPGMNRVNAFSTILYLSTIIHKNNETNEKSTNFSGN